jgi:hypothetical protein
MFTTAFENSCTTVSNISISSNQIYCFLQQWWFVPITEGVIIRNGAKYTEGQYTGNNLSSQINTNTDPTYKILATALAQDTPITDVAFLEFDFIPLSTNFVLIALFNMGLKFQYG